MLTTDARNSGLCTEGMSPGAGDWNYCNEEKCNLELNPDTFSKLQDGRLDGKSILTIYLDSDTILDAKAAHMDIKTVKLHLQLVTGKQIDNRKKVTGSEAMVASQITMDAAGEEQVSAIGQDGNGIECAGDEL